MPLRLVVVPEAGGKIVSLLDKPGRLRVADPAGARPIRSACCRPARSTTTSRWAAGTRCCPTILAGPYPEPGPYHGRGAARSRRAVDDGVGKTGDRAAMRSDLAAHGAGAALPAGKDACSAGRRPA